jgi:hypothetical protein
MATEIEAAAIRDRLLKKLAARQPDVERLDRYYRGDHDHPSVPAKVRAEFDRLMRQSRMNWCRLIGRAYAQRLNLVGFRPGNSNDADDVVWRLWQGNQLDADSKLVHIEALVCRRAFVLVWPDDSPVGVSATGEHPSETVVTYTSGSRRKRAAALKSWIDETTELGFATLYLPDEVWKWQTSRRVLNGSSVGRAWVRREVTDADGNLEDWPLDNPLGVVPMVEFTPLPMMRGEPLSVLDEDVIAIQDRINKTILDRLMAQEFTAFRQRWATGLAIPIDPETGREMEPFKAAVDRMFVSENPETKFGEFGQTDLSGYLNADETDTVHLAAITEVPAHYLLGKMANISGEALKAAETGLVAQSRDCQVHLGESWEEVARLMLLAIGDSQRAADFQSEVIWRDPETRSEGELVDALIKMASLGVPHEVLWQRWGASPQEIARWKAMQMSAAFSPAALAARAGLPPAQPALPPGNAQPAP